VAAVGEHRELDAGRSPVVEQGVDRRAHRTPREQDVVDEHHRAPVELEIEVRGVDDGLRPGLAARQIVAVERDVDVAERHLGPGELADERVQAAGEDRTAGVDADQSDGVRPRVLLDDLVRDPHQRAAYLVAIEHDPLRVGCHHAPLPGLAGPG
jgi:hypothetical protein